MTTMKGITHDQEPYTPEPNWKVEALVERYRRLYPNTPAPDLLKWIAFDLEMGRVERPSR